MNEPFFIVGCVRSGTTLLRDLLKLHPRLACPEETHIFRWAEPFANTDFDFVYRNAETLIQHRKIDGVDEQDFIKILENSTDRQSFFNKYTELFKTANGADNMRVFDKTPQNIYGIPLIKAYFPKAKFIQLIRNPLNVVASLKQGKQLAPQSLIGAINYWKESLLITHSLLPLWGEDFHILKYEDLTESPEIQLNAIMKFLDEQPYPELSQVKQLVRPAIDSFQDVLTLEEIEAVNSQLHQWIQALGY